MKNDKETKKFIPGSRILDITGKRHGMLTVLAFHSHAFHGRIRHRLWLCQCDCGKLIVLSHANMSGSSSRSCGCMSGRASMNRKKPNFFMEVN